MNPKQLDASAYTIFRKSLIREKGSERQLSFLESARQDLNFLEFIRGEVPTTNGDEIPVYGANLSEHEYKDPPSDTERALHESWSGVIPAVACRAAFWGEVTLRHIEEGRIRASYLAANGGALSGGLERIDRALSEGNETAIDSCVRAIIRRLSGLPERGNRSPYVDCPFGRAWWRERIAAEVCSSTSESRANVLGILRLKQSYWEEFINLIVSRNSIIGDKKVRDALVHSLIKQRANSDRSPIFTSAKLQKLCRLLGVRGAWQEFGVLEMSFLNSLISEEIDTHFSS